MADLGKSWADDHIARLKAGETIEISVNGRSMEPILMSGGQFTLMPFQEWKVKYGCDMLGRIVLVEQPRQVFLHRISDVVIVGLPGAEARWYLIANCGGTNGIKTNGWVTEGQVHGVLIIKKP